MIQVNYCKAYDIYRLEEITNEMIVQLEDQGNEVTNIQSFVTADRVFYSQIVYKKDV